MRFGMAKKWPLRLGRCFDLKWCSNVKMYHLADALATAPMFWCTIFCWLLPQILHVGFVAFALLWMRCRKSETYDLLPLLRTRNGVPLLRCMMCCRCFGLEMVLQCWGLRFVAVALVSKWCPNVLGWTNCCCFFGLEVVRHDKHGFSSLSMISFVNESTSVSGLESWNHGRKKLKRK